MSSRQALRAVAERAFLVGRGTIFRGTSVQCSVCDGSFRHFVHGGGSVKRRDRGYCPRCNAKARHRRAWLHLSQHTPIFTTPGSTLLVAPKPCEHHGFRRRGIPTVSVDLRLRPHVTHIGDVTNLPFDDAQFQYIVCIHVLEHVPDDRSAMSELARVLRDDGSLILSVPCELDALTYEDPSIVKPADRKEHFGEIDHVRIYGGDIVDRLAAGGLDCEVHVASELSETDMDTFGLTDDEHIFSCARSGSRAW